jgi:L-rhamnonate dehydratase
LVAFPKIKQVRAFVVRGANYHDQGGGHWIHDPIATPMARDPQYREIKPHRPHPR